MEYMQVRLCKQQRSNLGILATYLLALPEGYEKFEMASFMRYSERRPAKGSLDYAQSLQCGTSGCAVGHGPSAGIQPRHEEYWENYAERCFGAAGMLFEFLFSGEWHEFDNTPQGAGHRIKYFLKYGIPDGPDIDSENGVYHWAELSAADEFLKHD